MQNLLQVLPTKFQFSWLLGFRGEDLLAIYSNHAIRNKNCLWWPYLLTDRDEINYFIEDLQYMLPDQVSVHITKQFQRRRFLEIDQSEKKLPVAAMFVNELGRNDHSLQRTFRRCFLPSFGSFGQVVSEKKIFQKSINQKQELPVVAMFVNR